MFKNTLFALGRCYGWLKSSYVLMLWIPAEAMPEGLNQHPQALGPSWELGVPFLTPVLGISCQCEASPRPPNSLGCCVCGQSVDSPLSITKITHMQSGVECMMPAGQDQLFSLTQLMLANKNDVTKPLVCLHKHTMRPVTQATHLQNRS